jgi:hypothetical protein
VFKILNYASFRKFLLGPKNRLADLAHDFDRAR